MKIAIVDDWSNSLRVLQCFAKLDGLNVPVFSACIDAIDVFDKELITWQQDGLACHPNIIATPHIGFVTDNKSEMQFSEFVEKVWSWAYGRPINIVNPTIW